MTISSLSTSWWYFVFCWFLFEFMLLLKVFFSWQSFYYRLLGDTLLIVDFLIALCSRLTSWCKFEAFSYILSPRGDRYLHLSYDASLPLCGHFESLSVMSGEMGGCGIYFFGLILVGGFVDDRVYFSCLFCIRILFIYVSIELLYIVYACINRSVVYCLCMYQQSCCNLFIYVLT